MSRAWTRPCGTRRLLSGLPTALIFGMYENSAHLYDLMYSGKDYGAAAAGLHERIQQVHPEAESLLDVACGTGRHIEHLRNHYRVEGLDLSPDLLERARERCPDVEYHNGDMRSFSLGRSYDVVTCLFSSIGYMRTTADMRRAIATMASHLSDPGMLLVEPWFTPDTYWREHADMNVHDEPDVKLVWMYRHDSRGNELAILDIHFLVADIRHVEHFVEHHELGLFSREEMTDAFTSVGLEVRYEENEVFNRGLYIGSKGLG